MKTHFLKLNTEFYDDVEKRIKTAEIRYNDRNYEKGDWLVLEEWNGVNKTGYAIVRQIKSIYELDSIGLTNWVLLCIY